MMTLFVALGLTCSVLAFTVDAPQTTTVEEVKITVKPNPAPVGEILIVYWQPEELGMVGDNLYNRSGDLVDADLFDSQTHWIELPGVEESGWYILQLIDVEERLHATRFIVFD